MKHIQLTLNWRRPGIGNFTVFYANKKSIFCNSNLYPIWDVISQTGYCMYTIWEIGPNLMNIYRLYRK